jgi:hypothetical protein
LLCSGAADSLVSPPLLPLGIGFGQMEKKADKDETKGEKRYEQLSIPSLWQSRAAI